MAAGGSITADPTGAFVFFTTPGGGFQGWAINPATGVLTAVAGAPFAGSNPVERALAISPNRELLPTFANPAHAAGGVVSPNSDLGVRG